MARRNIAAILLCLGAALVPMRANADPTPPPTTESTTVRGTKAGDMLAESSSSQPDWTPSGQHDLSTSVTAPAADLPPTCQIGPNPPGCRPVQMCVEDDRSSTGYTQLTVTQNSVQGFDDQLGPSCTPSEASFAQAIPGAVLRAFQRIPLPQPVLSIQPPKGKTLIGLETIFSTNAEPFTRTVTLLGQQVQLRIEATSFTWTHGDGTTQTTDWSGRPWERGLPMDRYITHTYEATGTVRPQVRVTWSADYRVGNEPWQPVNGTVDRTSEPATLQVLEAEPHLVAP